MAGPWAARRFRLANEGSAARRTPFAGELLEPGDALGIRPRVTEQHTQRPAPLRACAGTQRRSNERSHLAEVDDLLVTPTFDLERPDRRPLPDHAHVDLHQFRSGLDRDRSVLTNHPESSVHTTRPPTIGFSSSGHIWLPLAVAGERV